MLLKSYTKRVFRAEYNPNLQSLYCFAELQEDIREVLPYLGGVLGGAVNSKKPPHISFKMRGKKIAVYPRKIVINALKDEEEADTILKWLQKVVNETWEKRLDIKKGKAVPSISDPVEIFSALPQSNCRECGQASCMSFSTLVAEEIKIPDDCPKISDETKERLKTYLAFFD
jgi:ArsR family metal-binding transcriptional regulator